MSAVCVVVVQLLSLTYTTLAVIDSNYQPHYTGTYQSSAAHRAVLPLRVKAHFCDLRSPLLSRYVPLVFFRFPLSPLRSAHLTFWPAPLRFPLRSNTLHGAVQMARHINICLTVFTF